MGKQLMQTQAHSLIKAVIPEFPHIECKTCECFLGYVTQLKLDAGFDIHSMVAEYIPEPNIVHSCLGCDPCPPGEHYSAYLHRRTAS